MVKPTDITVVLRCKVAVCGDAAVGKSALLSTYISKGQKFPATYSMTSGVEIVIAPVHVPDTTAMVELFLFDTAGQDIYTEMAPTYWNGIQIAMLVYDVTNPESFKSCKKWLDLIKSNRLDKDQPVTGVLVGTKADAPLQRHLVSTESGLEFATSNGLEFFEVAAAPPVKDYELPFVCLAQHFHKMYEEKVKSNMDACKNY